MPKIGNKKSFIKTNGISTPIDYVLMYTDNMFWIKIPDLYKAAVEAFGRDKYKEYGVSQQKQKGNRYDFSNAEVDYIIQHVTELKVISNFEILLHKIISEGIIERNIIIVHNETNPGSNYSGFSYSKGFEKKGVALGLTYAIETSIGTSDKSYKLLDGSRLTDSWIKNMTVIDDTPENREFVERIYNLLLTLKEALNKHLSSPESIELALKSNIKLIS